MNTPLNGISRLFFSLLSSMQPTRQFFWECWNNCRFGQNSERRREEMVAQICIFQSLSLTTVHCTYEAAFLSRIRYQFRAFHLLYIFIKWFFQLFIYPYNVKRHLRKLPILTTRCRVTNVRIGLLVNRSWEPTSQVSIRINFLSNWHYTSVNNNYLFNNNSYETRSVLSLERLSNDCVWYGCRCGVAVERQGWETRYVKIMVV